MIPSVSRRLISFVFRNSAKLFEIGTCKSLSITPLCDKMSDDIEGIEKLNQEYKGKSQYHIPYDISKAKGVSSYLEANTGSKEPHRVILDAGWNAKFMVKSFEEHGIISLLKKAAIPELVITNERFDHFLGFAGLIEHHPLLSILVPNTLSPEAHSYMMRDSIKGMLAPKNPRTHRGYLVQVPQDRMCQLDSGLATINFPAQIAAGIVGELALFVNVEKKGIVVLTGCCRTGIGKVLDWATQNIAGVDKIYGIYGGLHFAPHGSLLPTAKDEIEKIKSFGVQQIYPNHCTGEEGIAAMKKAGLKVMPVGEKINF